jgi:protein-L-isoaspartate(D-aspartate) O-methyltransferase
VNEQAWEHLVDRLVREGVLYSPRVIRSMRLVRRDLFVPNHLKSYAVVDSPLPIGYGQTVSAPHG